MLLLINQCIYQQRIGADNHHDFEIVMAPAVIIIIKLQVIFLLILVLMVVLYVGRYMIVESIMLIID